ncbi:hypothetical protein CJF30_00010702 [Rutstroemia sp. NJR-2017a BBW]|nr:hypothetical protein CJF30_00010702 [Rutstroemia sp. NJR-2017a BBW]
MLLAITFLILISSLSFDDILGQTYAIYIIAIAGAESAIGLVRSTPSHYSSSIPSFNIRRRARSYSTEAFNNRTPALSSSTSVLGLKGSTLAPWFITGLFDTESSFVIIILKNFKYKTGWDVQARVQINIHEKDRALIQAIQDYFGGISYVSKPNKALTVEFRVSTLKDLVHVIISHFDKYPLI